MGLWHVLLFELTFCLVVLTCESEESITKSILIQQQQCKFTTSLKVFDSHASLTLAFSFTIWSPVAGWLIICDQFFWWDNCICPLCFSKYATANNIIECLTYFQMKSEVSSFGELQSCFFTFILSWGPFLTKCFLNYIMCLVM